MTNTPDAALGHLARMRFDSLDLDGVLGRVCELAVDAVPGTAEVSLALLRTGTVVTAAHSGPRALRLGAAQSGPGLSLSPDSKGLLSDLRAETRWPEFSALALGLGIRSSLSLALPVQREVVGALTLYGESAFGADALGRATSFAGYAAVAVANAHLYRTSAGLADNLRLAMDSRASIEQAKGILMQRHGIDQDEAFALLARTSQHANRKLRDVAQDLIDGVVHPPLP